MHYTRGAVTLYTVALVVALFVVLGTSNERCLAYAIIALSTIIPIWLWTYRIGRTLPLVAILSSQDFVWYGLPLVVGNDSLKLYRPEDLVTAAISLGIYSLTLTCFWWGMVRRRPTSPRVLTFVDLETRKGSTKLIVSVLIAMAACVVVEFGLLLNWFWFILIRLPPGAMNPIQTCLSAAECGASLLLAHEIGRGRISAFPKVTFIILWLGVFFARIASVYISSCTTLIAAAVLGSYLGSRRIPWLTILLSILTLMFFNVSKFEIRAMYWSQFGGRSVLTLSKLPDFFADWANRSVSHFLGEDRALGVSPIEKRKNGQSLFQRVSNIQMLLYVQKRLEKAGDPLLYGETYRVVPVTLVPRVLWPSKPRSHIGQEILNVHFKLQTREETFRTYIAWGLVPESIGNFGFYFGPALLGMVLGVILGWIESKTSVLPLVSPYSILAGFIALSLVGVSGSVASLYLSSMVQLLFVIWIGLLPFLNKTSVDRSAVLASHRVDSSDSLPQKSQL